MKHYELLVGLEIKNDDLYAQYREAMKPLLIQCGGGFRYDFKVSEVLKNEEGRPINRVFVIFFENEDRMKRFFSNEEYLKIKQKYFEGSVGATTIISEYKYFTN
ncbi:DUF1330 domain-containing protein [Bacteriovoracaceae bacterium]|nr:DUF1330 domain-containing protein [Bacteriovoracaceae bacterium]